ncbi:MAG: hypothetical protein SFV22_07445 [Saprospiraceae bacterium]|nr:hypothetical protein [Saprospiraceae bacterium]
MNKAFFLIPALIFTLFACKNDPKNTSPNGAPAHIQPGEQANPTVLAGHWIALDFCAFASQYGSVLQAMNNSHIPYAYSFTFNPARPDSITCYNSFESWTLPVKMRADTIEVLEARPGKSVFLIYHSQEEKDIMMVDPTGPRTRLSRFIKSKAGTPDGRTAFIMALNHHLFSGVFTPLGKSSNEKINFFPHGAIQGMKEYDRYEVCSGGDCFVAGQDIDVVTLYQAKNKDATSKFYGYRYSAQNDTLSLYNLVNTNPQEKGMYKVAAPAYKFLRKKPD